MLEIIKGLFPKGEPVEPKEIAVADFKRFSPDEVKWAVKQLSTKKSPGPDGVPMEVVKVAVDCAPFLMAGLFNKLVLEEVVPAEWMEARLVLIKKPEKVGNQPSDFRPLCLIKQSGQSL